MTILRKDTNSKSVFVSPGSPVDLKLFVSADDMSQLTYTWFDDNEEEETVIDGADSLSYSIASVTEKHGYSCLVEDQYGNASSVSFIVDLLDYSDPQIIKDGDTREVSVTEESPYVLYEFTPTETADYTVSSSDNNTDPFVEVFNDSYELLYINDDGGEDGNFKLTELFTSGTTYYIRAKAFDTSSDGNYLIHLEKEPLLRQIIKAEEEMSLEYGNSGTISVTGAQGTLHFTSSKPAIVSVDSTGKVTANKIGTTDITIFADATETHYQSKTITVSVTVKKASIKNADVTGIVNKTYNGSEQTQTPVVKAGSATLTEGTDYTIDSYSDNINAGTASVTISGKGNYTDTVVKTFTIEKAAQNFTVKAGASAINVGKTTKVTASGAKETQKYTFTSSNNKIAAVNAAGTVTGKAAGTVTITVKTAETANYKAGSKTVKITVNKVLKKPGYCHFVKWNNSKYTSCRIGWNKTEGADGYETLLSWTDGSHASRTIVKSNVLYRDCTVHPQHVSQMMVRAFYMSGGQRKFGPWSNVEYITPSPTKLTAKNTSSGTNLKMNIKWNIIYGCNGYNVFLTTNPNGTWYWNQSTSIKADATSAAITKYRGSKLKKNTRYYVRIVTRRKRNGVFCTVPMPASNTNIGSFIIK